jgi:hypothetical protein
MKMAAFTAVSTPDHFNLYMPGGNCLLKKDQRRQHSYKKSKKVEI